MNSTSRIWSLSIALAGVLLAPACQQQQPPDTRAADEQALRDIEAEWSKAGAAKDIEKIMSFYADDAKNYRANAPIESGKDAIRAGQIKESAQKDYAMSGELSGVIVSSGGDLGITYGTSQTSWTDAAGKPALDKSKWITIYRKQPDGKFKCIMNIFNSDLPPQPVK